MTPKDQIEEDVKGILEQGEDEVTMTEPPPVPPPLFHQRMALKAFMVASSWKFVLGCGIISAFWMAFTFFPPVSFDPYPYAFLAFLFQIIGFYQASFILMAQSAQEQRETLYSDHQYKVIRWIEAELRALFHRVDKMEPDLAIAIEEVRLNNQILTRKIDELQELIEQTNGTAVYTQEILDRLADSCEKITELQRSNADELLAISKIIDRCKGPVLDDDDPTVEQEDLKGGSDND